MSLVVNQNNTCIKIWIYVIHSLTEYIGEYIVEPSVWNAAISCEVIKYHFIKIHTATSTEELAGVSFI